MATLRERALSAATAFDALTSSTSRVIGPRLSRYRDRLERVSTRPSSVARRSASTRPDVLSLR